MGMHRLKKSINLVNLNKNSSAMKKSVALNGDTEIEGIRYVYDFEHLKDLEKEKVPKNDFKITVIDQDTDGNAATEN